MRILSDKWKEKVNTGMDVQYIKYADINGDGLINSGDIVAIGSTTKPNLVYGFGLSAKWKGLDVNMHFQGAGKSSFFINGTTVHMFSGGDGWGNVLKEMAEGNRGICEVYNGYTYASLNSHVAKISSDGSYEYLS